MEQQQQRRPQRRGEAATSTVRGVATSTASSLVAVRWREHDARETSTTIGIDRFRAVLRYYRMCEAAQVGLGKNASVHSIHGSLLAVGELLRNTGEFMMSRYREVADIVLTYLKHRDQLVRRSITALLPRIAHFLRDRFVTNYLKVLLGDVGTGKSSLVLRFVKGQFVKFQMQESMIGAAFFSQTLAVNDGTVKIEIRDTAGQERYHSLAPMYYRVAAAAVVVYDITNAVLERSW